MTDVDKSNLPISDGVCFILRDISQDKSYGREGWMATKSTEGSECELQSFRPKFLEHNTVCLGTVWHLGRQDSGHRNVPSRDSHRLGPHVCIQSEVLVSMPAPSMHCKRK